MAKKFTGSKNKTASNKKIYFVWICATFAVIVVFLLSSLFFVIYDTKQYIGESSRSAEIIANPANMTNTTLRIFSDPKIVANSIISVQSIKIKPTGIGSYTMVIDAENTYDDTVRLPGRQNAALVHFNSWLLPGHYEVETHVSNKVGQTGNVITTSTIKGDFSVTL